LLPAEKSIIAKRAKATVERLSLAADRKAKCRPARCTAPQGLKLTVAMPALISSWTTLASLMTTAL